MNIRKITFIIASGALNHVSEKRSLQPAAKNPAAYKLIVIEYNEYSSYLLSSTFIFGITFYKMTHLCLQLL